MREFKIPTKLISMCKTCVQETRSTTDNEQLTHLINLMDRQRGKVLLAKLLKCS